jgi:SAM-dependent methyltransferase
MREAGSWTDFFNGTHQLYVNARHKGLHYQTLARDIVALIEAPDAKILDFGCGEALTATEIARHCETLYLHDAAPNVAQGLRANFGHVANIVVLSEADLAALPPGSLDMIIVNSVLQYVSPAVLESLLDVWRPLLRDDGRLILADVIPTGLGIVPDVKALIASAWKGGFLAAAVVGLARTYLSRYRALKKELGLTTYRPEAIQATLAAHGFACAKANRNLGHNQHRMTFVGTKVG